MKLSMHGAAASSANAYGVNASVRAVGMSNANVGVSSILSVGAVGVWVVVIGVPFGWLVDGDVGLARWDRSG